MLDLDDLKIYLPKYLSSKEEDELIDSLRNFPNNIENKMYSDIGKETDFIYQGDGIKDLLLINFPDERVDKGNGMIVSNTCDIHEEHKRFFSPRICYTPIFNLNKYRQALLEKQVFGENNIDAHLDSIKKQQITQIIYLPSNGTTMDDSIVFLDRINNCKNEYIDRSQLNQSRLFTLSMYGFYIFLIKLSIHFTRIRENVSRA